MIIFLYTTNQHQKWDNFYFEHFPQNSILTLDRPHRNRRAPVDQVTPRDRRAFVEKMCTNFEDIFSPNFSTNTWRTQGVTWSTGARRMR